MPVFSTKPSNFARNPPKLVRANRRRSTLIEADLEREVGLEGGESPASGDRPVSGPSDWLGGCVRLFGTLLKLRTIASQKRAGVLAFKAHRLVYHSTLGLRVIKKKKRIDVNLRIVCQLENSEGGELPGSGERAMSGSSAWLPKGGYVRLFRTVLNFRTNNLQKCAAVPRRARISGP